MFLAIRKYEKSFFANKLYFHEFTSQKNYTYILAMKLAKIKINFAKVIY